MTTIEQVYFIYFYKPIQILKSSPDLLNRLSKFVIASVYFVIAFRKIEFASPTFERLPEL